MNGGGGKTDLPQVDTHVYDSRRAEYGMSREAPADANKLSDEELTELLADAEGTTPEEIEHGAAELEIAPPEEAAVVDADE
jgi:hypothetical protein